MAYVTPTPELFKARFPEFTSVSDTLVGLVLGEAVERVGDTWLERDRARAQMYLAAHLLAMEGEPARSAAIANGGTGGETLLNGAVKRRRVGDVETEFAGVSSGDVGSSGGLAASYTSTAYGRRYLELMRLNFPSVAAV